MGLMLNFPPPEEGIIHMEPNVTAYADNRELGTGTVYITESVFCFMLSKDEGFSLDYQSIFIHAVSVDLRNFHTEHLLLMVDPAIKLDELPEAGEESDLVRGLRSLTVDDDYSDEENPSPLHMRFAPENKNMLNIMFRAISDCQGLHPDPDDVSDGEGDNNAFNLFNNIQHGVIKDDGDYYDEDEDQMNGDQFEDAED